MNIIITGGGSGLGLFLAKNFLKAGHNVGLLSRHLSSSSILPISADNPATGQVYLRDCDLINANQTKEKIKDLISEMGNPDVLINNVGVAIKKGLLEMSEEEWTQSISTNVSSAFFCTQAVTPYFLRNGKGCIINISSLSCKIPLERGISYTAGKSALNAFSKSLIHELHDKNIKVCTIYPGAFTTIAQPSPGEAWKMSAEDLANACHFILSTGQNTFVEELVIRPLNWPD